MHKVRKFLDLRVLKPFEFLEPETVESAVRILTSYGATAQVLNGGVNLLIAMRRREIEPECVVSIQRIPQLNYIEGDRVKGLRIGALATLRDIELSALVQRDYPLLYEAVHQIASVQVKNMGTAIGNLCVATPASDVSPALIALGAELKVASLAPTRVIPIESFFVGVNKTILQPGELVTEISVSSPTDNTYGAFLKLANLTADIAKVNVAVMMTVTNNTCKDVKIALGSVGPTVIRARKAEEALEGGKLEEKMIAKAAEAAAEEAKPITDLRSTAEYRKEVTSVLVRRAINKALERAKA
jgi:carbon-monoxide dehydrogenase medium subunit